MSYVATDFMKQTNNTLEAILVYAGDGCLSAATAIAVKQVMKSMSLRIPERSERILPTELNINHNIILLTKTTAAQKKIARRYHRVRGLYFLAVVFVANIVVHCTMYIIHYIKKIKCT